MVTIASAAPRIALVPDASTSLGREAIELAASAGLVLDDWQAMVLEAALGVRDDGLWSAFTVGLNVSRQNGKGGILLARELAGLFLLEEQMLVHTAHQFDTSLDAFRRLEELIADTPELHARVKPRGYKHSHGEEGIELRSGQRIRFRTRTKGGGRGFSGDCVLFDEAMIVPESVQTALLPTLSARPNPQVWYTGSAVDRRIHEHGEVFARVRERALAGGDPRLAYFEWSLDDNAWGEDGRPGGPDRVPIEVARDPESWRRANPAFGIRVTEEYLREEIRELGPRGFAVERLGVGDWPPTSRFDESGLPLEVWDDLEDVRSKPLDPVCIAFDLTPRRSWSSIAIAGFRRDGLPHVEVIDLREGTGWVPDRLVELQRRWKPAAVGFGKDSPAESLAPDLDRLRLRNVQPLTVAENAAACGRIHDAVVDQALRHLGDRSPYGAALRAAIAGAVQRPVGDKWLWSRAKSQVNIAPLVSVTLALYLLSLHAVPRARPMVAFA